MFVANDGMTYNVPAPDEFTEEQRLEILHQIKRRLSIGGRPQGG